MVRPVGLLNQQRVLEPGPRVGFIHALAPLCVQSPKTFHSISLVCKAWRQVALSEPFRRLLQELLAPHFVGKSDYQHYFKGDCGPELPIPLGFLINFEEGRTFLTFAPKSLRFTQASGETVEEPTSLDNVGKWAKSPVQGEGKDVIYCRPMMYDLSNEPAIDHSHWIFHEKFPSSRETTSPAHFPPLSSMSLTDLTLSLLMHRIKTGIELFRFDECNVGTSATLYGRSLALGFDPDGLIVFEYCDQFYPIYAGAHARCSYS
ncbi:MAG: hypothetical protein ACK5MA_04570 [Parachlamydiaceae bacterium]